MPAKKVLVTIASEDGDYIVEMTEADMIEAKALLRKAQRKGEWPDAVNDIIDRSRKLKTVGSINTMGDGWGWYKP